MTPRARLLALGRRSSYLLQPLPDEVHGARPCPHLTSLLVRLVPSTLPSSHFLSFLLSPSPTSSSSILPGKASRLPSSRCNKSPASPQQPRRTASQHLHARHLPVQTRKQKPQTRKKSASVSSFYWIPVPPCSACGLWQGPTCHHRTGIRKKTVPLLPLHPPSRRHTRDTSTLICATRALSHHLWPQISTHISYWVWPCAWLYLTVVGPPSAPPPLLHFEREKNKESTPKGRKKK